MVMGRVVLLGLGAFGTDIAADLFGARFLMFVAGARLTVHWVLGVTMMAMVVSAAFMVLVLMLAILPMLGMRTGARGSLRRQGSSEDKRDRADNRLHFNSPKRVKLIEGSFRRLSEAEW
jgi:hypothetical protein